MSRDELAVLDGNKCILQLRGVRLFLSDKYDLTQHPNYKYTADYDKKLTFDIEKFLDTWAKLNPKDTLKDRPRGSVLSDLSERKEAVTAANLPGKLPRNPAPPDNHTDSLNTLQQAGSICRLPALQPNPHGRPHLPGKASLIRRSILIDGMSDVWYIETNSCSSEV